MEYYIINTEKGYVGRIYRGQKDNVMYNCDYVDDGLLAIKCPIRNVWHEEKLKLEIENYLESKNIPYQVNILDYNIRYYWRSDE